MSFAAALEIARSAASASAATVRFGGREIAYSATVDLDERSGRMRIHVRQDNALREAASKELARATREAIREALRAAGIPFRVVSWGGKAWRQTGHTHMRAFWCDGRYAELVLSAATAEAPAARVVAFELTASAGGTRLRLVGSSGEAASRAFEREAEARAAAAAVRARIPAGFEAASAELAAFGG